MRSAQPLPARILRDERFRAIEGDASAFGAGFGGSVWALVAVDRIDDFLAAWQRSYAERFPDRAPQATFFPTAAGPALCRFA